MKAEEVAMKVFLGDGSYTAGAPPPQAIAAALTLAQQEARAAALEEVARLKAEIRAAIQAQHYESEAHEATEDECAIDGMSMCQACGNEWPCDDPECWVTRLRALLEGK